MATTTEILDSILKYLDQNKKEYKEIDNIEKHVKETFNIEMQTLDILVHLDVLLDEGYVVREIAKFTKKRMSDGAVLEAHDLNYYYLSNKGRQLVIDGGYGVMVEHRKEDEKFERDKRAAELRSMTVATETNEAVRNFIPDQRKQGWITALAAVVSLFFIVATTVDGCQNHSEEELRGIKETLQEQVEINQQLKQSVDKLIKSQEKVVDTTSKRKP